jgi:hypothetical protein
MQGCVPRCYAVAEWCLGRRWMRGVKSQARTNGDARDAMAAEHPCWLGHDVLKLSAVCN